MRFAAVTVFLCALGVVATRVGDIAAEYGAHGDRAIEGVSNIIILCPSTHQEILLTVFNYSDM